MASSKQEALQNIQKALDKVDSGWETIVTNAQDTVEEKESEIDIVTQADKDVERILSETLETCDERAGLLGEESGAIRETSDGGIYIIDPIDGTFNFARQIPMYCVSIAYQQDGEIEAAGVLYPSLGQRVEVVRGEGVTFDGEPLAALRCTEMGVSENDTIQGSAISVTSVRGHCGQLSRHVEDCVVANGGRTVSILCVVYLMTEVSRGAIDGGVVFGAEPWDLASGYLLIEELGGTVTTPDGDDSWEAIKDGDAVFSNGLLHENLLSYVVEE